MRPTCSAFLLSILLAAPAAAEWVIGYEGDDTRGYGFLSRIERRPLGSNRAIVYAVTASYLFYDIRESEGTTRVTSPGLGAGVVYKWTYDRMEIGLGPGYELRWTTRKHPSGVESDDTESGPFLLGDLTYRIDAVTRALAQASYSDANEWLFTRAHVLREITPSLRFGPEISFQGNDDVGVRSWGGIAEIPFQDRTALQFHTGQSNIRYRDGSEENHPYFSVGVARSF